MDNIKSLIRELIAEKEKLIATQKEFGSIGYDGTERSFLKGELSGKIIALSFCIKKIDSYCWEGRKKQGS